MNPDRSDPVGSEAERWLVRLQSRDCSESERARFRDWLQADPAHARAYRTAEYYWRRASELERDADLRAIVETSRARQRQRRAFWDRWGPRSPALAAALVVVLAVGVGAFGHRNEWFAPAPATYATAVGERRDVRLEDGSVLTLNTDSAVEVSYRRHARQVNLARGEAQFDVQRDPDRPFRVATAAGVSVVALGTRFQVRTDDASTAVTLLEGRVRVTDAEGTGAARSAELAPGDRLVVQAGQPGWQRDTVDPDDAAGWIEGRLAFRSVPLPEAIREVNRYTARKLRLADASLDGILLNGIFDAGDAEGVLGALEYAYPVQVDRTSPEEVVLRRR